MKKYNGFTLLEMLIVIVVLLPYQVIRDMSFEPNAWKLATHYRQ